MILQVHISVKEGIKCDFKFRTECCPAVLKLGSVLSSCNLVVVAYFTAAIGTCFLLLDRPIKYNGKNCILRQGVCRSSSKYSNLPTEQVIRKLKRAPGMS